MHDDLIFHIVEKKDWNRFKHNGRYTPDSIEAEGFIHCSTGSQINETVNRIFKNNRHLLLLIIDSKRVEPAIKYEQDEEQNESFPHIYGALNQDAILDKIKLTPDKEGNFNLTFSSD